MAFGGGALCALVMQAASDDQFHGTAAATIIAESVYFSNSAIPMTHKLHQVFMARDRRSGRPHSAAADRLK